MYEQFKHLSFTRPSPGVLMVTIDRPPMNTMNERLHWELGRVWIDVDEDEETRVAVVTGAGKAFSAGGDIGMVQRTQGDFAAVAKTFREAADIVLNMINCSKPIVSAINGVAVGGGAAVALMADISIISETARLGDAHVKIGLAAGDHAAIIWPILCGMAKAKYYLLTSEILDGREAERIGLVSKCVPDEETIPSALRVAEQIAAGPEAATRWTKRALNHWLRQAGSTFEFSLALEMLTFFDPDLKEGVDAFRTKRAPEFPSSDAARRSTLGPRR